MSVKPSSTGALFPLPTMNLREFTLTLLLKIDSGTISQRVNLASINSQLSIEFENWTTGTIYDSVSGNSCSVLASYTHGSHLGDWLPLSLAYSGTQLRMN